MFRGLCFEDFNRSVSFSLISNVSKAFWWFLIGDRGGVHAIGPTRPGNGLEVKVKRR